jgi:riboflavin biosynthesis pyrimidine reductase
MIGPIFTWIWLHELNGKQARFPVKYSWHTGGADRENVHPVRAMIEDDDCGNCRI